MDRFLQTEGARQKIGSQRTGEGEKWRGTTAADTNQEIMDARVSEWSRTRARLREDAPMPFSTAVHRPSLR
jgi:hypothetical protein